MKINSIELDLSLQYTEVVVPAPGTPEGKKVYKLFEMTGVQRDAFLKRIQNQMTIGPDGKPTGVKKVEGLQSALLNGTLQNDAGEFLTAEQIDNLPQRVVDCLFKIQQKQSGLDAGKDEEAKND